MPAGMLVLNLTEALQQQADIDQPAVPVLGQLLLTDDLKLTELTRLTQSICGHHCLPVLLESDCKGSLVRALSDAVVSVAQMHLMAGLYIIQNRTDQNRTEQCTASCRMPLLCI